MFGRVSTKPRWANLHKKNVPPEYLLLNEHPEDHDEMDTKLFYLKEINDYISKGRLQKFMNTDEILSVYK